MAGSDEKISVYSLPDLKNTTDDALPNYLNSLKFKQSHFLADVHLGLGYTAVIIAAALFAYDYKFGWEASKPYTLSAVAAYFVLNGALTVWVMAIERGKIYTGERNGDLISVASKTEKHSPTYTLNFNFQRAERSSTFTHDSLQIQSSFTRWFSSDGRFLARPFQTWLQEKVPVIADAAKSK